MSDAKQENKKTAVPLDEILDWLAENTDNLIQAQMLVAMTAIALQEEEGRTLEEQIELALNTIKDGNFTVRTFPISRLKH